MGCWQISSRAAPAAVPVVMKGPMHQTGPVTGLQPELTHILLMLHDFITEEDVLVTQ